MFCCCFPLPLTPSPVERGNVCCFVVVCSCVLSSRKIAKTSHINMFFLRHETLLKRKKELCLCKSYAPFPSGLPAVASAKAGERGWGKEGENKNTQTTSSPSQNHHTYIWFPFDSSPHASLGSTIVPP